MAKLLYIQASPRKERSHSLTVANAFVEAWRASHRDGSVDTLNVFTEKLPAMDGLTVQAKYTILHGKQHTPEELEAWRAVEAAIERFKSADRYVIALGMWNFGIPYRLKQYIDVIVQPTYTFSYDPKTGYTGLVSGRKAACIYARGGAYGPGTGGEAYDFQRPYLDLILGFMGISDIHSIVIEPTLMAGPEAAKKSQNAALEMAKEMARGF